MCGTRRGDNGARGRDFARGSCFFGSNPRSRSPGRAGLGKRRCLGTTRFVARSFTNKDVRDQYRGSSLRVVSKLQKPSGDARCKDLKRRKSGDGSCISPATIKTESQTAASRRGPSHNKAERHPESPPHWTRPVRRSAPRRSKSSSSRVNRSRLADAPASETLRPNSHERLFGAQSSKTSSSRVGDGSTDGRNASRARGRTSLALGDWLKPSQAKTNDSLHAPGSDSSSAIGTSQRGVR